MRGFPLLGTLAVIAFFVAAWWPLRALTGSRPAGPGNDSSAASAVSEGAPQSVGTLENFTLRITTSRPVEKLVVEHLGKPVLEFDAPLGGSDLERRLEGIALPPEGIEFWLDAAFVPGPVETPEPFRVALSVEIIPDDPERETRQISLWGAPGENTIADLAVFQWPESEIETTVSPNP